METGRPDLGESFGGAVSWCRVCWSSPPSSSSPSADLVAHPTRPPTHHSRLHHPLFPCFLACMPACLPACLLACLQASSLCLWQALKFLWLRMSLAEYVIWFFVLLSGGVCFTNSMAALKGSPGKPPKLQSYLFWYVHCPCPHHPHTTGHRSFLKSRRVVLLGAFRSLGVVSALYNTTLCSQLKRSHPFCCACYVLTSCVSLPLPLWSFYSLCSLAGTRRGI